MRANWPLCPFHCSVAPGQFQKWEEKLTALTEDGVAFSADDYTILGLGSGRVPVLWSAPDAHTARQGEVISATLVFEIPDRAVELTLVGEDGGRLALGVGHHTGDR